MDESKGKRLFLLQLLLTFSA